MWCTAYSNAHRAAIIYPLLTLLIIWLNRAQARRIWQAFITPDIGKQALRRYWLADGATVVLATTLLLEHWITH